MTVSSNTSAPIGELFPLADGIHKDTLEIELTNRCNLSCAQCPRTAYEETWIGRDMPWELFEQFAPFVQRFRSVNLQGWGEPLLHSRIEDIVYVIKDFGVDITLSTNGTQPIPDSVLQSVDTIVFRLGTGKARTYETANPEHSFNRVIFNISRTVHKISGFARPPLVILSLLKNAVTFRELPEYLNLASKLSVNSVVLHEPRFHMRPVDDQAGIAGNLDPKIIESREKALSNYAQSLGVSLIDNAKTNVCPFNAGMDLFVNWKGQASPCRYNHLPITGNYFEYYQDGEPQLVRPFYYGYLTNRGWWEKTISIAGKSRCHCENPLTAFLDKSRVKPATFAARCPMKEKTRRRIPSLCI